ncbi:MAG: ROK family protein [Armatimonadota bacterium]
MEHEEINGVSQLRLTNKIAVLNQVREAQSMSRAQIARECNFSRPTASKIARELMEECFLEEIGVDLTSRRAGKPGLLLRLNPELGYVLGVEIGIGRARAVVTDICANIIGKAECILEHSMSTELLQSVVRAISDEALQAAGIPSQRIIGIGLGVTGVVDPGSGALTYSSHHPDWQGFDLTELFRSFPVPIFVHNEVKAAALAECWFGVARDVDEMVYVHVTEGIGAAIMVGGRLHLGLGIAGEIGHTVIQADGELCSCGNRGCLNTLASESALARAAGELNARPRTADQIIYAALDGDQDMREIVIRCARYLGIGLANVINSLSPEMIVVDSKFTSKCPDAFDVVTKTALQYALPQPKPVRIEMARLADSVAIGAAMQVLRDIFRRPEKYVSPKRAKEGILSCE